MSWATQGTRFVLYAALGVVLPDAPTLWDAILAPRKPDNTQRTSNLGISQSSASGNVRGVTFTLNVQPGRLDLFAAPSSNDWLVSSVSPADPGDILKSARFYGDKCIDQIKCFRVALVTDVFSHHDALDAVIAQMKHELPFLPSLKDNMDLTFQVNPTMPFVCDESRTMYRLCRWSSAVFQLMKFQVQASPADFSGSGNVVEERRGLTYQMDLSNDQRGAPLDTATAKAILGELEIETRVLLDQGFRRLST